MNIELHLKKNTNKKKSSEHFKEDKGYTHQGNHHLLIHHLISPRYRFGENLHSSTN